MSEFNVTVTEETANTVEVTELDEISVTVQEQEKTVIIKDLAGVQGIPGSSAYEIAIDNGFVGTEQDWLDSLKGADGVIGVDGKSAYEIAVENGFVGTEAQWLASLQGADGDPGPQGPQGNPGATGATGPNQVSTSTSTNITGLLKGNGSTVSAASADSDYLTPGTASSTYQTQSGLAAAALAIVLAGLSTATNAVITASDSILSALGKLQAQISANLSSLNSHTSNTSNPHSVTKSQVGLSAVQNVDTTTTANISDSTNKRFVTDANIVTLSNTSGTNTGDQNLDPYQLISNLASDVRAILLTGLSTATNSAILATDSILVAFGKLQAQITANIAAIALKAPLDNPALTGTPTAPTASPGTNTTQIATTAFVIAQFNNYVDGGSPSAIYGGTNPIDGGAP